MFTFLGFTFMTVCHVWRYYVMPAQVIAKALLGETIYNVLANCLEDYIMNAIFA